VTDRQPVSRKSVATNLAWKFFERGGVQIAQFITSIVIARILSPEEFGVVALLTVFIAIATIFVQSGLNTALIQKKDADETDSSSVFYCSLMLAALLYLLLFFSAPWIARFYHMPELTSTLRVMAVMLFPGAFNSVQNAVVAKNMQFKKQFYAGMVAVVLSGVAGIALALYNFGAWALVYQQLLFQIITCVVLWFAVKWRPTLSFSFTRAKSLFRYGSKLLGARLIDSTYHNIVSLVIGRQFSAETLAFHNKGKMFPFILNNNIDGSIQSVMLPAYSAHQDDMIRVKAMVRRTVTLSTYLVFPAMLGLAAMGETLIAVVLGAQWNGAVPFLQLYCLVVLLIPLQTASLQAINAVGRSDIFFKLMVIKRIVSIVLLAVAVIFFQNVFVIVIAGLMIEMLATAINIIPNKRILHYSASELLKDIGPNIVIALFMGGLMYALLYIPIHPIFVLGMQGIVGVVLYALLSAAFKNPSFSYLCDIWKQKRRTKESV